jgi:small subunit ribosomal protein S12
MSKKSQGMNAAKKLMKKRAVSRLKNKNFKRKFYGLRIKSDPLKGSSQAKAIVIEKIQREAKQPNSAMRKCAKVQLVKNGKQVTAYLPGDGATKVIDEHDEVLIECIGGKMGRSKGDISGVRLTVIKVNDQSLLGLRTGKIQKARK